MLRDHHCTASIRSHQLRKQVKRFFVLLFLDYNEQRTLTSTTSSDCPAAKLCCVIITAQPAYDRTSSASKRNTADFGISGCCAFSSSIRSLTLFSVVVWAALIVLVGSLLDGLASWLVVVVGVLEVVASYRKKHG